MARPLRMDYEGAVHHVICRGNDRRDIFRADADRRRFMEILEETLASHCVKLLAYVLMSNHFHLLVETPQANLSEFMRRLNVTYTTYFNRKYRRSGHLFQGRFKNVLVERETYLHVVSRYIHLNPVRIARLRGKPLEERVAELRSYPWSSLPDYLQTRPRRYIDDPELALLGYGGNTPEAREAYWKVLLSDLEHPEQKLDNKAGLALGSAAFLNALKGRMPLDAEREQPCARRLASQGWLEIIPRVFLKDEDGDLACLVRDRHPRRFLAAEALYRLGGLNNREIGERLGVDYSTVSVWRKRGREMMEQDPECRAIWGQILSAPG